VLFYNQESVGGHGYVPESGTYRMCGVDTKAMYVEVLYFRHFYIHFVFVEDEDGNLNKRMKKQKFVNYL